MKISLKTPEEIQDQIWKELGRAALDRHHEWRTPVLATSTEDGSVNARTVVLRRVDSDEGQLEIYTDSRSSKVSELSQNPIAQFVFWSTRLNWQLRVRTECTILTSGTYVESLWQNVKQSPSSGDYLTLVEPGAPMTNNESQHHKNQNQHQGQNPKNYFAVISCQILEIDWLELSRAGHRRANLKNKQWQWLVP